MKQSKQRRSAGTARQRSLTVRFLTSLIALFLALAPGPGHDALASIDHFGMHHVSAQDVDAPGTADRDTTMASCPSPVLCMALGVLDESGNGRFGPERPGGRFVLVDWIGDGRSASSIFRPPIG